MRLSRVWCLLLVGCPAVVLAGDDESRAVARTTADSLASLWADHHQGTMRAIVAVDSTAPSSAEIVLTWKDENVRVNVVDHRHTALNRQGETGTVTLPPSTQLYTSRESWEYVAAVNSAFGKAGPRREHLPSAVNALPRDCWHTVPNFPRMTYQKLFLGPKFSVSGMRMPDGRFRFGSEPLYVTVSPEADFLPVLTESLMHGVMKEDFTPFVARYEWSRDFNGVLYCSGYQLQWYTWNRRLASTETIDVLEYESRPALTLLRFSVDDMGIPKGTRMRYSDGRRSRSWTYGEEKSAGSAVSDVDFQRLIDVARSKGFSSTQRADQ